VLFLVAFGLIRAAGPTYGSDVDGTWTISVAPEHPRVGDAIEVRATANGTQSPTRLSLQIEQNEDDPVVELIDNPYGYGAIITFDAVASGTATIRGTGFFEKPVCPTPDSDFCFPYGFYLTTPDIVIEVAPACGDANGDGVVNSIDAAWTLQYAAGMIQTIVFPAGADVNDDGAADAVDATLVLQVDAALLSPDALHCPPPTTP
jgi:hypothetical protein